MRSIIAILACATAIAACGSSANDKAASNSVPQPFAFSKCMRAHGVTSFPDPNGKQFQSLGPGVNPYSPTFQAAQKACGKFQPGPTGPPHMSESDRLAALKFSQCMRTHGLPSFPDPGAPAGGNGPVLVLRGMEFTPGPGLNPASPAFRQAASRCGLRLPG